MRKRYDAFYSHSLRCLWKRYKIKKPVRRLVRVLFVATCAGMFVLLPKLIRSPDSIDDQSESLDLGPAGDGHMQLKKKTMCLNHNHPINVNEQPNAAAKVVWVPSYPGSGSTLMVTLLGNMTGLIADDMHVSSCLENNTVSCKTHIPAMGQMQDILEKQTIRPFHNTSLLLLRNPALALPSFSNFIWEYFRRSMEKQSGRTHQMQSPQSNWRAWRDKGFESKLNKWFLLLESWNTDDRPPPSYVPYEELVNPGLGPALLMQVAIVLRQAGFATVSNDEILCLWHRVVVEYPTARRQRDYEPLYRPEQTMIMIQKLDQTIQRYAHDHRLVAILRRYQDQIYLAPNDTGTDQNANTLD